MAGELGRRKTLAAGLNTPYQANVEDIYKFLRRDVGRQPLHRSGWRLDLRYPLPALSIVPRVVCSSPTGLPGGLGVESLGVKLVPESMGIVIPPGGNYT